MASMYPDFDYFRSASERMQRPGLAPAPAVAPLTSAPVPPSASGVVPQAQPDFPSLSGQAHGIASQLMGGMPSASPTRRANAYFGVGSGMPNSDFVRNRGFDLYSEKAENYQQRGFDDFLKLLQGESGTLTPTVGQSLQDRQFQQNIGQQEADRAQSSLQFQQNRSDRGPEFLGTGVEEGRVLGKNQKFAKYRDARGKLYAKTY